MEILRAATMVTNTNRTQIEICELYGLSRSTFEKWIRLGLVPPPAEVVRHARGGRPARYWTIEQVSALKPYVEAFRGGLSSYEIAHKHKPHTS